MDDFDARDYVISIHAGDIRECAAFAVPFYADSLYAAWATEGFGFSAFDADARDILGHALRDAARRCAFFWLEDSYFDGWAHIRI